MELRKGKPVWLSMNLLSLDGPLVALVWQDFLARCYPTPLMPAGRWVLGLTVWAIYIADRILDVRVPANERETRHHRFHRAHRRGFVLILAVVVVADILVTVEWLRPAVFVHGLAVAALSVLYLVAFTGAGRRWAVWKKSAAAILFSAGVFVVASTSTEHPLHSLFLPWSAFAVLCAGNLALIELWKQCRSTRWVCPALTVFALTCAIAGRSPWYFAIALSSISMAALCQWESKVPVEARRTLADVALFTPLLLR
jgi:hypothetical protein